MSSAYWPWIWPQPGSEAGFTLEPAGSTLELPVRMVDAENGADIGFERPEQSEPMGVVYPATLDEQRPERLCVRDVAKGEWRLEVDPRYGGTRVYPDGLEFTEDAVETYVIQESDPLRAHPLRLVDPPAPARAGVGRDDQDPLRNRLRRDGLHHQQRGGVPGRRRGGLPPDLGAADSAYGGVSVRGGAGGARG